MIRADVLRDKSAMSEAEIQQAGVHKQRRYNKLCTLYTTSYDVTSHDDNVGGKETLRRDMSD